MACIMDGVYALIANRTVTGIEMNLIAIVIVLEIQTLIVVKVAESVFMKLTLTQLQLMAVCPLLLMVSCQNMYYKCTVMPISFIITMSTFRNL